MSPTNQSRPHSRQLALGRAGEGQAAAFLQRQGYQIQDRNWRHGRDEIDLIAFDSARQELVFVEVKTRRTATHGDPALACDARKLTAQTRAAAHYLRAHPCSLDYRFDLIAVLPTSIEHYENITWP